MSKTGRKGSASDADGTQHRTSPVKTRVTQSKAFREGAIYLYQRSDFKKPTWLCRVKVPGGKGYVNRSTGTGDEHMAFKFADDLYNHLLVKSLTGEAHVGKRMGPAIDAYIKRLEPQRERLSIHYKILLMQRVKPFLERRTFDELSTSLISKLVEDRARQTKKRQLSPNSVKRIFSDLKHFFNWCVEEGHLKTIPTFPKLKSDPTRRPHFNREEWHQILRAVPDYYDGSPRSVRRDRFLMLYYMLILAETGIRVGEARHLRWRDLRPVNNNKNPDDANIALTVKGKTGIREVVASGPVVREALNSILKRRRKDLKDETSDIYNKDAVPLDSFIFCNKHGNAIGSFKKSFSAFIEHVDLTFDTFGQRRTIYSLRHTYATTRIEAGVNHYALAKNMGTSVAMLERFYGHTTNIGMADELTKPKTKRVANSRKDSGSTLDWLGSRK